MEKRDFYFYLKVQEMRDMQKRYFKSRDKHALIESKRLEAEVDSEIRDFFHIPVEVDQQVADNMPKLF
jgi:hypothetical protein